MTLGDDLLLLAVHPRSGRVHRPERMDLVLRAAELLELLLAGRIGVTSGRPRIVVESAAPTADRRLDTVLRLLGEASPAPTVGEWLKRSSRGTTLSYLSRLEGQGALTVDRRAKRYAGSPAPITLLDRARRADLRRRVAGAAGDPERTAADHALAALVNTAGLSRRLYRGPHRRPLRRRLARLAESAPLALGAVAALVPGDAELAAAISEAVSTGVRELNSQLSKELRAEHRMEDAAGGHHGHHGSGGHHGHGGGHGGYGGEP
ncbi:GPP34 family phosphoprotein [Kitasatospora sp. NPDC004799]|uniref:GOLPH3/VPS74 family protein n=1 Tax=Kitasatospora sp. NPDC004799 TaxID=3154460 RepID=UPI0033B560FA